MMARPATGLLLAAALAVQGCFPAGYVAQAARGEAGILAAARPIRDVVTDAEAPARVRRLVAAVPGIKAFGADHGLRATRNYGRYADLRRPTAVWVVQACAPLSFDMRRWDLPVVGTIPYLGFFDAGRARRYAEALRAEEGLDVAVRGASAFSTLGWLQDPVLSTMIPPGDEALGELADVIFHESVHATIYVNDQSAFDESLASFVADRLAPRWLDATLGPAAPEARAWKAAHAAHERRLARLHRAYVELDALYRSGRSEEEKRAEKARRLAALGAELGWREPPNNATLADFRTYGSGTAAFERLLEACGGSWTRLMQAVRTLDATSFARPQQEPFDDVLDRLAARHCPR